MVRQLSSVFCVSQRGVPKGCTRRVSQVSLSSRTRRRTNGILTLSRVVFQSLRLTQYLYTIISGLEVSTLIRNHPNTLLFPFPGSKDRSNIEERKDGFLSPLLNVLLPFCTWCQTFVWNLCVPFMDPPFLNLWFRLFPLPLVHVLVLNLFPSPSPVSIPT